MIQTALVLALIALSVMLPILTITAFILGYNVNAQKKLFVKAKKPELTEDEELLKRIDSLTVDDF